MPDKALFRPEFRDVDGRAILLFGAGLIGVIVLALVIIRLIFGTSPPPLPFGAESSVFGSSNPTLQTSPEADRAAYDAEKNAERLAFGWIDRPGGIARIPVEEAMRLIVEHGVPDWGQHAAPGDCARIGADVPRAPPITGCPTSGAKAEP